MDQPNPMVAVVIYEALGRGADRGVDAALLHAAVNAWLEGHIAAEGETTAGPDPVASREVPPSPPFPSREDATLRDIITGTKELFSSEHLLPAAVAFAAGLAYGTGYGEGKRCPGCSFRGISAAKAADIRAGHRPIWLFQGRASTGVPLTMNPSPRHVDLGRRLCAAWLSYAHGLAAVDYTYKQMKDDDVGNAWIALGELANEVMAERMAELVGPIMGPDVQDRTN